MNLVLWIAQGLLALAFLAAGATKLSQSKEHLAPRMAWVEDWSQPMIRVIGGLEVAGALGLILPALLGILPILTPLAASGLALLMVAAALTHYRRREYSMLPVNLALFALSVFVAWGRFGPYSL